MEAELTPSLSIPGYIRAVIARFVGPLERGEQGRVLFWRRQEFDLGGQLHSGTSAQFQDVERIDRYRSGRKLTLAGQAKFLPGTDFWSIHFARSFL
jgi:hypothetical protein